MKLTKNNYYTNKNRYISNSKIGDWLQCKRYFYEKHVLGRKEEKTDAMIMGSALDDYLTGSKTRFERNYMPVKRRSKVNASDDITEITETMYSTIIGMAKAVRATDAYKEIKKRKFKSQKILQKDMDLGRFKGICGVPDWFLIEDGHCTIVDLKSSIETEAQKYYWKCEKFNYFRQLGMYCMLLEHNYPEIKTFQCFHLVAGKAPEDVKKGIFKVAWFELNQEKILEEAHNILDILEDIKKEKHFKKKDVKFSEPVMIGSSWKKTK